MKWINAEAWGEYLRFLLLWTCLLILGLGFVSGIVFQWDAIRFRYPLDYGEAPLINQAVLINSSGQQVYRVADQEAPYTIANYPPIFIGVLSIFERIFGLEFWYGRLVSALSAHGSAIMIFLIVFSYSHNTKLALIPSLLFLNLPYVIGWSTLARIDHLALFFALAGLYCLVRYQQNSSLYWFIFGSTGLILAIFTRQSYALAAPMAGFFLLFRRDWRKALLLTAVVGGGALLIFLIFNILTEGGFYFNIVTANVNPFGFDRMLNHFRDFYSQAWILFILAALGVILLIKQLQDWPLFIGFLMGGFLSALTIGKIGSNVNYFLEFSAGISLAAGMAMVILSKASRPKWIKYLQFVLLLTAAWQSIQLVREVQNRRRWQLDERVANAESLETMEALVSRYKDSPILADEYMGLILLNGEMLYLQPFEMTQLAQAGLWDQEILLEQIRQEKFPLIMIQRSSWWEAAAQERWTPEMLAMIDEHYQQYTQLDNTIIYQPRTQKTKPELITSCPSGVWPLPTEAYLGYRYRDGILTLYGAGGEGQVPVYAVANGFVYRPEGWSGLLLVIHDDPLHPGNNIMLVYQDLVSFDGETSLIAASFPPGTAGKSVTAGTLLGFQSQWAGAAYQQAWLHVKVGLVPHNEDFLENPDLVLGALVHPGPYFGIDITENNPSVTPIKCQGP